METRHLYLRETTKTAIIDKEDFDKCVRYEWVIYKNKNTNYARAYVNRSDFAYNLRRKYLRLHHLIIGKPPEGKVTDHINRNGLDNRKSNLRFVTRKENRNNSIDSY